MRRAAFVPTLLALIVSREALASIGFPIAIKDHLALQGEPPPCTYCHRDNGGGPDSIVRPFGLTAKNKYGLVRTDTNRLKTVITAMEANGDDSDGDRVGDIAELRAGTDPNVNDLTGATRDVPIYGIYCAAVPGRHGSLGAGTVWVASLFLAAWRISSRRGRVRR